MRNTCISCQKPVADPIRCDDCGRVICRDCVIMTRDMDLLCRSCVRERQREYWSYMVSAIPVIHADAALPR